MEAVRYDYDNVLMLLRKMQISGLDIILSVLHKYIDQTQCGWPTSQGDDSQSALWLLFMNILLCTSNIIPYFIIIIVLYPAGFRGGIRLVSPLRIGQILPSFDWPILKLRGPK